METKKKFDVKERVKNAAKELIRAVVWENVIWGGGEQEEVLNKVVEDCLEKHGDALIENALTLAHNTYLLGYIERNS